MEKSKVEFFEADHSYRFNGKWVPSVSQILLDGGFIDPKWFTEAGRDRGSGVHNHIKNLSLGVHCLQPKSEYVPYIEAFKNFMRDCEWIPEMVEVPLGCSQYSGTPDQVGLYHGKKAILDFKTGIISAATGLQLCGYNKLIDPSERYLRLALQLTDTGRYILNTYKDRMDYYIWDSAVACWWFKKNHKIIK